MYSSDELRQGKRLNIDNNSSIDIMGYMIISCSLEKDLVHRVDVVRGDVPRSKFIARALEAILSKESEVKKK